LAGYGILVFFTRPCKRSLTFGNKPTSVVLPYEVCRYAQWASALTSELRAPVYNHHNRPQQDNL
jgi:hypothetical protein